MHVSEIADRHVKDPADELEVGDTLKVKILKIDADSHKISLSAKEAESASRAPQREQEPEVPAEPLSKYEQDGKVSLGDVIDLSGLGALSRGTDEESGEEE